MERNKKDDYGVQSSIFGHKENQKSNLLITRDGLKGI
jgi:hypothetical protein